MRTQLAVVSRLEGIVPWWSIRANTVAAFFSVCSSLLLSAPQAGMVKVKTKAKLYMAVLRIAEGINAFFIMAEPS
jgi:hypothetical protein